MPAFLPPCRTVGDAWAALQAQKGLSDGEAVDLWAHQVQTAALLHQQGADDETVQAALLHDLGDGRVSEAEHAQWGADLVRPLLGERVANGPPRAARRVAVAAPQADRNRPAAGSAGREGAAKPRSEPREFGMWSGSRRADTLSAEGGAKGTAAPFP